MVVSVSCGWAHTLCVATDILAALATQHNKASRVPNGSHPPDVGADRELAVRRSSRDLDETEEKQAVARGEMLPQYVCVRARVCVCVCL